MLHRRPLALLLPLTLLSLAACTSPCRELSQRVCECRDTRIEREACAQNAGNNEGRLEPSSEQQDLCEQKLDTCPDPAANGGKDRVALCDELERSVDRKVACGLTAAGPDAGTP
ncbi:hypothetical protein FGE12_21685 [Aggregicoccus sp. 17bor-14]|uniref:hypothetical protein n=1 Tax=Myxococcaceae TaxID=31 RepID=UPI00129C1939|nr:MULTISPECIES: hypothetical protein [Myxococcaceae]MBF5045029.1 hypothetical protein [Simulacricoccus sp. 17bor-14]MRI90772.1 hypothetical protein [Aggregicoccus sp. 17bor-14]